MNLTEWSSKISSAAGNEPYKMEFQNFIRGRPSQDLKLGNLQYENFVTGRPSKDHEPYKMELQNFIRGRPSQDHEPGNL